MQGRITIVSDFDISLGNTISATVSNKIEIADLGLTYQHIDQAIEKLAWQGYTDVSDKGQVRVKGELHISHSSTTDNKQNYLISSFQDLTITGLEKKAEALSFGKLDMVNAR